MKRIGPEGARRSREAVRGQPWEYGWLNIGPEPNARHANRSHRAAMLMPMDGSMVAQAELHAVVVTVERRGMLLDGVEESFRRKERLERRETWWCKPISEQDYERAMTPDPVDASEAVEHLQVAAVAGDPPSYANHQREFIDRVARAVGRQLAPSEEAYVASAMVHGADLQTLSRFFRRQDASRLDLSCEALSK